MATSVIFYLNKDKRGYRKGSSCGQDVNDNLIALRSSEYFF